MEKSKISYVMIVFSVLVGGGILLFALMSPLMPPAPISPVGQLKGFGVFVIMVMLIAGIAYFFFSSSSESSADDKNHLDAEEILKARYAKGEITDEEFEKMLKNIRK